MIFLYGIYILTLALLLYIIFLLVRMGGSRAAAALQCSDMSMLLLILGLMLEVIMGDDVDAALVCLKLQYLGQAAFLMSLLYFFSIFLHVHIPAAVYWVQLAVNAVVLTGCLTAEHHTLFYSSTRIVFDGPYPMIKVTDGPIWYLHYFHLFCVFLAVIGYMLAKYGKSSARQKMRCRYLLAGLGVMTVELIMKGMGLFGPFNPFVIAAFIYVVCTYLGVQRLGYFDTVDAAIDNVLNFSTEGLLVSDDQGRILYLNAQMKSLFPDLRAGASARMAGPVADIFDGQREIRWNNVYYKAVLDEVNEENLRGGRMLRLIDMTGYLNEMDRLRRENENKTRFLSGVSHEIRTPLNTIRGMNEMIFRECRDAQIRAYSEDIREAEETLMSLVGDVLDVTRIEESRMVLEPAEFPAGRLFRRLLTGAELKCNKKGLALEFSVEPSVPAVWFADEARMYQIMENLLSNAVKYTEEGLVTFRVYRESEEELCIEVRDTGIGISEEGIGKIFNRFEQLDTGYRSQGLGLGLEITKKIVDLMGGNISVASEVGKGSCFTVKLPVKFVPCGGETVGRDWRRTGAPVREITVYRCAKGRILVVDDNEMNRRVIRQYLKDSGITVEEADSGETCLKLLEQGNRYDLLFLDHMMPEMDGIELFHRLTKLDAYRESPVPVVVMTANAVLGARKMYLAQGFDACLFKPVDVQELYSLLQDYLGGVQETAPSGWQAQTGEEPDSENDGQTGLTEETLLRLAASGMDLELAKRYSDGSMRFLAEETELFLKQGPEMMLAMKTDWQERNLRSLAVRVHALKNNFAALGFSELAAQAKNLEQGLRSEAEQPSEDDVRAFLRRYGGLVREMEKILHGDTDGKAAEC